MYARSTAWLESRFVGKRFVVNEQTHVEKHRFYSSNTIISRAREHLVRELWRSADKLRTVALFPSFYFLTGAACFCIGCEFNECG